ncbi:MAG: hypothetical protein ABJN36_09935 [Cyclobacteriaceae bacterium]
MKGKSKALSCDYSYCLLDINFTLINDLIGGVEYQQGRTSEVG